ncbi:hypothetical protein PM10SUCC1_23840 [Propionigenium maris DSM 9537]|uniref:Uncharacterized protein n=1 Tax=Propionigenium maris DSM 9537 TaxID=1123000 RepID=A0A9W6LPF1_9FUSO|nr:hypothetical protein [Propionigenium maris]GLI56870.1 hypothetical protein PM10SUCC1_23840 [Propionigenium maris DSM 9537]
MKEKSCCREKKQEKHTCQCGGSKDGNEEKHGSGCRSRECKCHEKKRG